MLLNSKMLFFAKKLLKNVGHILLIYAPIMITFKIIMKRAVQWLP